MATLALLRTRCKTRTRDTNNAIWSDAEWTSYINDAYDDAIGDSPWWPFLKAKNTAFSYTAQAASMPLPTADVYRVNSVMNLTDRYPLAPLSGAASAVDAYPYADTAFGNPIHYRIYNQTLEVYPRPLVTITLQLEYMVTPVDLSGDSDVPIFPAQYHQGILVAGAMARAYEDDGNSAMAETHWKKYNETVEDMKTDLLSTQTENYPIIQDVWEWQ